MLIILILLRYETNHHSIQKKKSYWRRVLSFKTLNKANMKGKENFQEKAGNLLQIVVIFQKTGAI
jgi:hypothetical protein